MFPNLKNAFDKLKFKLTSVFSAGNVALSKFNALRGMMILLAFSDFTSDLLYLTKRWPSVATKVVFLSPRFTYTPVIAGLNSSLLVAKIVLLTALANTSDAISAV